MPAGKVSVKVTDVCGARLNEVRATEKVATSPGATVVGAKVLATVSALLRTSSAAERAGEMKPWSLVTPWVLPTLPAGMLLVWVPGVSEVTG